MRLKQEIIDKESFDTAEDVFFALKVARTYNMIMQTNCPALEDKITNYVRISFLIKRYLLRLEFENCQCVL